MTTLIETAGDRTATTCLCWQLEREDGFVLRLTEHDRQVVVQGETFEPGAAVEASSFTSTADLTPGHASIRGALSSDAITEADIAAGLWDRASVRVWRADWSRGERLGLVWTGRLSEVRREGARMSAALVSLKAALQRSIGRAYTRQCDARLGDARCGVDLNAPGHAGKTCDQAFETCCNLFANGESFRGFPHMPGADFLIAGPANGRAS